MPEKGIRKKEKEEHT